MIEKQCPACGKRIVLVRTADGKAVPLDPTPPVYVVRPAPGDEQRAGAPTRYRAELVKLSTYLAPAGKMRRAMVSHFATCTDPERFSKKQ